MPYSEQMADTIRADLGPVPGLSEKKMFGGLCFFINGNMLGGVGKDGALFRPGKPAEAAALALQGVTPMVMGGRRMGGFIRLANDQFEDDSIRTQLVEMSLANASSLPPKD